MILGDGNMSDTIFYETYTIDLPCETTCYSTGPFHERYNHNNPPLQQEQEEQSKKRSMIIIHPIMMMMMMDCTNHHSKEKEAKNKEESLSIRNKKKDWNLHSLRIATTHQRVIVSVIPPGGAGDNAINPKSCLHTKMKSFNKKKQKLHPSSVVKIVAYSTTRFSYYDSSSSSSSSCSSLLEAYISSSCDLTTNNNTIMTFHNPISSSSSIIIDGQNESLNSSSNNNAMDKKKKIYTLTVQASISFQNLKNPYKILSQLELSYTPLSIHLCPWTAVTEAAGEEEEGESVYTTTELQRSIDSLNHSYMALLFIGCMEEPFLKCYHIGISTTKTHSIIHPTTLYNNSTSNIPKSPNNELISLLIQEVTNTNQYPYSTIYPSLAIPSSLTPCFHPTPISLSTVAVAFTSSLSSSSSSLSSSFVSSSINHNTATTLNHNSSTTSSTTSSNLQEGNESFLPSSYWDALLTPHVQSFLSTTSSTSTKGESSCHYEKKQESFSQKQQQQQQQKHEPNYTSFLPLTFSSPVMGMHSLLLENVHSSTFTTNTNNIYYLAFSCQDGTIRVITFTIHSPLHLYNSISSSSTSSTTTSWIPSFHIHNVSEMIVDGPILAIHLSATPNSTFTSSTTRNPSSCIVLLTVGSMCGTACQFFQLNSYSTFQGPQTIGYSLWNPSIDVEDAITAVVCFDSFVIIGTCSGRILFFQKQIVEENHYISSLYIQTMEKKLYYPIHSIHVEDVDEDGMIEIIICTRKSIHLFRESQLFQKKNMATKIQNEIQRAFQKVS